MKITSIFQKGKNTFVTADDGNTYLLQKIDVQDTLSIDEDIDLDLITKINDMLKSLQFSSHYAGYKILVHCIYFTIKNKKCRDRLCVNLYPRVARIHNIMSASVPASLTTIIHQWSEKEQYKEIFGHKLVSAKIFILGLADYYKTYK